MPFNETQCPRGLDCCTPLANIVSDQRTSFICVGANRPEDREHKPDRFTHCWHNPVTDERGHWDKRDLLDTISVMSQALSLDENIRVNLGEVTEEVMQEKHFV